MTVPPDHPIRGLSPRPFALHLALGMAALTSSKAGLASSSGGSPRSSDRSSRLWPEFPESLAAEIRRSDPGALSAALDAAILEAASRFAEGVRAYRAHPYRRGQEHVDVIWSDGATNLLDHRGEGIPALFVPSLINRGWVLDLQPGHGMLSWLARHGTHPYRIEWGPPGIAEQNFDIGDYVMRRLEPALQETVRRSGRPVVLVGYCMGGLLTIAAAVSRPDLVSGLGLLATPWDFHAEAAQRSEAMAALYRSIRPAAALLGQLPVDLVQGFFAMPDPVVALRKFQRFATLDPDSAEARAFVALEDWLNDGVPVTLPVADDALLGWYGANTPERGTWKPGAAAIDPTSLTMPALVAIPGADRIVPPASAAAILDKIPHAERLDPPLGHIGMVVGRRAEAALWRPLADWIARTGGGRRRGSSRSRRLPRTRRRT
ncbi:MAG TPA: alpha/beta fold hydrolase [Alphaproteobacteria bacterium]|nr:alpha/beta fold hydrolase [Alphaproteobacteria bacterium]